jgi:transposase
MMTKKKDSAEKAIRDIRRATRRQYSAEEKIRIALEGLRGESSIAELCRKEGINHNLYAETLLENRLLKKSSYGAGGNDT